MTSASTATIMCTVVVGRMMMMPILMMTLILLIVVVVPNNNKYNNNVVMAFVTVGGSGITPRLPPTVTIRSFYSIIQDHHSYSYYCNCKHYGQRRRVTTQDHTHHLLYSNAISSSSSSLSASTSLSATTTRTTITTTTKEMTGPITVGPRLPINDDYPGLERIYSNPDIFIVRNFLHNTYCQDIIDRALDKKLDPSPVAYAGWTTDVKDLLELAAKGPIVWGALIGSWYQLKDDSNANQIDLVIHAIQNYTILLIVVTIIIGVWTYSRAEGLKSMRTSTSTTLDDLSTDSMMNGPKEFVRKAAILFQSTNDDNDDERDGTPSHRLRTEASYFEAPTVIRYEADQVLAPHYDANRSAQTEDANRGGQTLATLIVYLNDVNAGGLTRFGKLHAFPPPPSTTTTNTSNDNNNNENTKDVDDDGKLVVRPRRGDALLFFPADRYGMFDDRTEHEGMPAIDEKWIARIWRHQSRVPPPFGLSESALDEI